MKSFMGSFYRWWALSAIIAAVGWLLSPSRGDWISLAILVVVFSPLVAMGMALLTLMKKLLKSGPHVKQPVKSASTSSNSIEANQSKDTSSEPDIPEHFSGMFSWNFQSCPNCGVNFEVLPTKDGTCDDCDEKYLARSVQPSRDRVLFLPNELKVFNKHKATLNFRRRAIRFITNHNVASVDDFVQQEKHMLSDGQSWGSKDVVWALLNKAKLDLIATGLLISASHLTWLQALWLYEENSGSKFIDLLEQHRKETIEAIGRLDKELRFSLANDCCDGCRSSETFQGNSEEWLAKGVPQHSCTNVINPKRKEGWCTCDFSVSWSVKDGSEIVEGTYITE